MTKIEQARERLKVVLAEMSRISESVEGLDTELETEQAETFADLNTEQKRLKANIQMWETTATAAEEADALPPRRSMAGGTALAFDPSAANLGGTLPRRESFEAAAFEPLPKIPATPIATLGKLKFFTGPTGHEEAINAAMWARATLFKDERASKFCHEHGIPIRAALSEGVNSAGGFFVVPETITNRMIDLKEQYGVFRANTNVETMASDTKTVPRRVGGPTAYAIGENTEITASDGEWDQVELVARKWGCLTKMSSELGEDSAVSMIDKMLVEFAYAFSKKEDDAGFIGDGTSTYHGIKGVITAMGAGSYQSMGAGDRAFSDIVVADDIETMIGKLPQYALTGGNCKWYISSTGFASFMMRILDAMGGNTAANLQAGYEKQFLGFPVVITQSLHNVTTDAAVDTVILLFGDLRMSTTLGDRRSFRLKVSDDRYMEYDQIGLMATMRYDINCHDVGTASAAGPIVGLRSGAS